MLNKKLLSIIITITLLSSVCPLVNAQKDVTDSISSQIRTSLRLGGQDRYDTSEIINKENNKIHKIEGVMLANGENFPDALSGSVFSKKYNTPVLLCGSTVPESKKALDFIMNTLPKEKVVYILGNENTIKEEIDKNLISNGYIVKRLGGFDRFDTNLKIVNEFNAQKGTPVVLANGQNFPDALSMSSLASIKGYPIILTPSHEMPTYSLLKVKELEPKKVYIAGGKGSISDNVIKELKEVAGVDESNIIRLGGQDRYDTSLKIADFFKLESKDAVIANGENFPDALSGSALASQKTAPIILVDNNEVSRQKSFLDKSKYNNLIILGGQGSVSEKVKSLLCGE